MRVAFFSQHAFDEMQALAFAIAKKFPDKSWWLFTDYPVEHSLNIPKNLQWQALPEPNRYLGGLIQSSHHRRVELQLRNAQIDMLVTDDLRCRKIQSIRKLLRINRMLSVREQGSEADWGNTVAVPINPLVTPNYHLARCIPLYMGSPEHPQLAFHMFPPHASIVSDYFFAEIGACSAEELTLFLKGYSQFKKFQKSSMKMQLGIHAKDRKKWEQLLSNYAWRSEVSLVEDATEKRKGMGNAYAVCFLHVEEDIHNLLLPLLLAKKPCAVVEDRCLRELFGQGLVEMQLTEQSVAKLLMEFYKDEAAQLERNAWMEDWVRYHQQASVLDAWLGLMFR